MHPHLILLAAQLLSVASPAHAASPFFAVDGSMEANGWRVGKNPMKSWKATLANWAARDKASGRGTMYAGASPDANTAAYESVL